MPPRPPAGCRALQRQLLTPSDSIWLSDDALSNAFQKFYLLSKTARRYESHVPGPMECRRRLGKRRMGNLSEAISTPASHIGLTWGFFGEVDRTQWQWQAPTPKLTDPPPEASGRTLPKWLLDWDVTQNEEASEAEKTILVEEPSAVEDILTRFRDGIETAPSYEAIKDLVTDLNTHFKKELALGTVSEEIIWNSLDLVTADITRNMERCMRTEKEIHDICFDFYQSIWQGMIASKGLKTSDFDGKLLDFYIIQISNLYMTFNVRSLAHDVLLSASENQLLKMERGISVLVRKWSLTWGDGKTFLQEEPLGCQRQSRTRIEFLLVEASDNIARAQNLASMMKPAPSRYLFNPQKTAEADPKEEFKDSLREDMRGAIHRARAHISQIEELMTRLERTLFPRSASVEMLAHALGNIPAQVLANIVPVYSDSIIDSCLQSMHPYFSIRYWWASLVARLPKAREELFLDTWRKMEMHSYSKEQRPFFNESQSGALILHHWISQGRISRVDRVKNYYEFYRTFPSLLLAIDKFEKQSSARIGDFFRLIEQLQMFPLVPDILEEMDSLHLKLPVKIFSKIIDTMSTEIPGERLARPWEALRVWELHFHMRIGPEVVDVAAIPNFIVSLINCPGLVSPRIFEILAIPMYNLNQHSNPGDNPPSRPLTKTTIKLMHLMATAFAHSRYRTRRSALHNIELCLYHLRRHSAPIGQEFSKALCHVAITREMLNENWMVTDRLRWVLTIIEKLEGREVAEKVDALAVKWRERIVAMQEEERRRRNPLRVAPIN